MFLPTRPRTLVMSSFTGFCAPAAAGQCELPRTIRRNIVQSLGERPLTITLSNHHMLQTSARVSEPALSFSRATYLNSRPACVLADR